MNGKFLLDTNIIISLFAQDKSVLEKLTEAQEVFIPSIAVGELYFGAYKSSKVELNIGRIKEFVFANTILVCDENTADFYGLVKSKLRNKGKPIPENDIWISAIALQHGLLLVSRDPHFNQVDEVVTVFW